MIDRFFKFLRKYPLSLAVLLAIIYLSFFKPPKIDMKEVKNLDKVVHFIMYGGLCAVIWFEYFLTHMVVSIRKVFLWGIVAPILFSGAIELGQSFLTDHRGGDIWDFMFNSLGVVCATLFSIFITKPLMKKYHFWGKRKEK